MSDYLQPHEPQREYISPKYEHLAKNWYTF